MLGYTAADVDDLAQDDFRSLCAALDKYDEKARAAAAQIDDAIKGR